MTRKEMKARAKFLMKQGNPKPLYFSAVYVLIGLLLSALTFAVMFPGIEKAVAYLQQSGADFSSSYGTFSGTYHTDDPQVVFEALSMMISPAARLIILAIGVVEVMLAAGYVIFTLHTVEGNDASYGNLFDAFGMFFRILWLQILTGLFIYLWALLFVIPGIIAAYRYRMAIYLRLEHPELSAMECIRESKRLMNGHKWELFVFDLSFLGWAFLGGLVMGIGQAIGGAAVIIATVIYVIYYIWLGMYIQLSCTIYYKNRVGYFDVINGNPEQNYNSQSWNPEL